jgi:hypothetical protein
MSEIAENTPNTDRTIPHPMGEFAEMFQPGFTGKTIATKSGKVYSCYVAEKSMLIRDLDDENIVATATVKDEPGFGKTINFFVNTKNSIDRHKPVEVVQADIRPRVFIREAFAHFDKPDDPIMCYEGYWPRYVSRGHGRNFDEYHKALSDLAEANDGEITDDMRKKAATETWSYGNAKGLGFTEVVRVDDISYDRVYAYMRRPAEASTQPDQREDQVPE